MSSPSLQLRARAELLRRERARQRAELGATISFRQIVGEVFPSFRFYRHSEVIAGAIERLLAGDIRKLFIAAPPQSGKSELAKLAVTTRLRQRPDLFAGVSSYGANLARKISRTARGYYHRSGGALRADARAADVWELPEGGGLWAYGVAGGQTGNPANFLLLDDPIKNPQEAASPVIQERNRDWYDAAWRSRWNPYGGPLLELMIGTRWDVNDLMGYALEQGGWHCVILPAVMPHQPIEIPEGNTLEPDWREPGEPLCPELPKFTREEIEKERVKLKSKRFAALYQQAPEPDEGGGIFKRFWFGTRAIDPALELVDGAQRGESVYAASCRSWDLAASEEANDQTAGVKMGRLLEGGGIVVRHVVTARVNSGGVKRLMASTMITDGPDVAITFPIDPGQAGIFQATELADFLRKKAAAAGMACPRLQAIRPSIDKVSRAKPFAGAAEPVDQEGKIPGNVVVVAGPWVDAYLDEVHNFDGVEGHADDQVDASSDAYSQVAGSTDRSGWHTG